MRVVGWSAQGSVVSRVECTVAYQSLNAPPSDEKVNSNNRRDETRQERRERFGDRMPYGLTDSMIEKMEEMDSM